MSQQICLKWNNHPSIINDFQTFLSTEALVDVTLTCDGKRLKAHKLVLSAGSALFQSLFLENPCKHPIIILQGIGYAELKTVIDFMYNGEVNITEDKLAAVIKCAETLRVKVLGDVMIDSDESANQPEKAPVNQPGNEFEIQSGAVAANNSRNQSENAPDDRQPHQPAARTDTFSNPHKSSEMNENEDDMSNVDHVIADPVVKDLSVDMDSNASDASTATMLFIPNNMVSPTKSQKESLPIKESADEVLMPVPFQSTNSPCSSQEGLPIEENIETSTMPLSSHSINSSYSLQEEQLIEESMREAIVVIEDFENIPISMVERLLTDDVSIHYVVI